VLRIELLRPVERVALRAHVVADAIMGVVERGHEEEGEEEGK